MNPPIPATRDTAPIRERRAAASATFLATCALSALALSACTLGAEDASPIPEVDPARWEEELSWLKQAAKESRNEQFILDIIADGKITDEEALQALKNEEKCVQDKGFTEFAYAADGSMKIPADMRDKHEEWNPLIEACTTETAGTYVRVVWEDMSVNPLNIDEDEYLATCLVKLGAVEPSLTGDDLRKARDEFSAGGATESHPLASLPFLVSAEEGERAVTRCYSEPEKIIYGAGQ